MNKCFQEWSWTKRELLIEYVKDEEDVKCPPILYHLDDTSKIKLVDNLLNIVLIWSMLLSFRWHQEVFIKISVQDVEIISTYIKM